MPATQVASAPGKLVLVGEYAILEGGPAISAAVNIVATATLQPAAQGSSELRVANCGGHYGFNLAPGGALEWLADPGDRGALLDAVARILGARGYLQQSLPPVILELCTRSFYSAQETGLTQKIGIGSSAAMAVALTSALQCFLGREPAFDVCLDVHRLFQRGRGSGIDVATSWYGGVIAMQPNGGNAPDISRLPWPRGLNVVPVWTGESAPTMPMLQRFESFRAHSGKTCSNIMQRMASASVDAGKHWRAGDADMVMAALDEFGHLLHELDSAAAIGIWSDRHVGLNRVAREHGVGYKPSGAGGGDFGLAFSRDASRLQDFITRVDSELVAQPARLGWTETGLVINGDLVAMPAG